MRLFFPKQAHHRTNKMTLVHVRLYVLLVVFNFDSRNGVKISDQSQAHIEKLIGMWLKNPCLFPNRISGTSIFCVGEPSAEDSGYYVPDILLWDPLTQFTVELSCPHCLTTSIANQLHATRWKDGKTSYDQPRNMDCIQRHVYCW